MLSVLYVDDERDLLELGKLYLEQSPEIRVDVQTSAEEALALPEFRAYDVIVSDYQMPGMNGIDFLRAVRAQFGTIPFILFTGRGREVVVIEAINNGADFYLQKGGDPQAQFAELAHKIKIAVERRQAMDAVKDSEQRLSDIINFLPDATFAIDRSGRVIAWNRAIEEMTGISASDILGKGDYEYAIAFYGTRRKILIDLIFEPDDFITKNYGHITHEKGILIADTTLPRPKGRPVMLLGKASPLYNRQGEMVGAIESIRDITELKTVEEELRAEEEKYRVVVENSHETIYIYRGDRFLFVNRRAIELTGYSHDEIMANEVWDIIHPEDRMRLQVFGQQRIAGIQIPPVFTTRLLTKSGEIRIGEFFVDRILYLGQPAILGIIRDITEQNLAEEKLHESESRFAAFMNYLPVTAFIKDQDSTNLFVNKRMAELFGAHEWIGQSVRSIFPPEAAEKMIEDDLKVLQDGDLKTIENLTVKNGDRRIFETFKFRIDRENKPPLIGGFAVDITDRRNAEEDLRAAHDELAASSEELKAQFDELVRSEQRIRESEAKYRELAELLPQIIFEMDLSFNITYANRHALAAFGMTEKDIASGMNALERIDPSQHGRVRENVEKILQGRSPDNHEYTAIRPDGSTLPILIYPAPIYRAGELVGFRGVILDISDRKKAEDNLRESEEKYRALVELSPDAVVVYRDGKILYANPECVRLVRSGSAGDLVGRTLLPFVHPDDRERLAEEFRLMEERGDTIPLREERLITADGQPFTAEVTSKPILYQGLPAIMVVFRDVTERKRMGEEIEAQQQQLKNFMENLPVGLFRTTPGPSGRRVMTNPILAHLHGYDSVEEFMQCPVADLYVDPGVRKIISDRLVRDGVLLNYETQLKKKNGGVFWASLSVIAVRGPDGSVEFFDGVLEDITERKRAASALSEANRKLSLLNSITRHDITNQLTALQGFAQIASMKKSDPLVEDYLAKILNIAGTITSQIEFARAYQDLGMKAPAWFRLEDVVARTTTSVPITFSGTCRGVEIFADPLLERVFFNLFDNAARHGGRLNVITVRCEREPDNFLVIVEDDGSGIPLVEKEQIFERGFGKNSGLGLFLVKEILAISGITIRETGIPGNGARFEMLVPKNAFRFST
ncbi:PAS domain S-box protein [Methanoregula sp.]|uniref:response regulator n=1 Tax=Methanoregula sp. TaxID=2052170 RepID=UPI00356AFD32